MAYIEREELLNNLKRFAPEHLTPLIVNLVQKQPSADVVEVVRCRDCVFSREMDKYEKKLYLKTCIGCTKHSVSYRSVIMQGDDYYSYGERKECADQKPVTNFECFKKIIAKMSIDELAKVIKDSDNCEKFCVFTKDGRCDSRGDADVCEIGVKRYLESEVSE